MGWEMMKNKICFILLCCFFLFVLIYHAFLLFTVNGKQEKTADSSGIQKPDIVFNVLDADIAPEIPDAKAGEEKETADEEPPPLSEELEAVRQFREKDFPGLKAEIIAAAGFDVSIEIDWDSLAAKGWAHIYESAFPKVYFLPVVRALKKYTAQASDPSSLQGVLKKITIKNSGRYFNTNGISLDKGILVIDHQPQANIDIAASEREEWILELLVKASGS